jgi:hypothetical protein
MFCGGAEAAKEEGEEGTHGAYGVGLVKIEKAIVPFKIVKNSQNSSTRLI